MTSTGPAHVVLLPVKPPARGKSRLSDVDPAARAELARAFALDTVEACLAAERVAAVLVVTDDAALWRSVTEVGATALPDGVSGDLNGTLVQAAAEAARRWPGSTPVALCGDLPALRPVDLDTALAVPSPAYVADATGAGTTLYVAPYDAFAPAFGPGSAGAHAAAGATAVEGELVSLRRDVDTREDLAEALRLGLGPRTTLAVVQHGLL